MDSTFIKFKNPLLWEDSDMWTHKSCEAEIIDGWKWATVYAIFSKEKNQWHATQLLKDAKAYYEWLWKEFGWTVALNPIMKHLYEKLSINEYS